MNSEKRNNVGTREMCDKELKAQLEELDTQIEEVLSKADNAKAEYIEQLEARD